MIIIVIFIIIFIIIIIIIIRSYKYGQWQWQCQYQYQWQTSFLSQILVFLAALLVEGQPVKLEMDCHIWYKYEYIYMQTLSLKNTIKGPEKTPTDSESHQYNFERL